MVRWRDIHVRKATMWMVCQRGHVVKMVAGMALIQFVGYMVSLRQMGCEVTKHVFGVSDKVRLKPVSSPSETN